MDYIKKLLQALLDTLVPPGTIIMYGGSQVPDGYILIQNVKVYQDEFPRLYPVLSACPELEKGNDSGRAWVKMVNPDGRVPQFTTTGSLVWKLLEAALPNITGALYSQPYGEDRDNIFVWSSGAFSTNLSGTTGNGSLAVDLSVQGKTLSYLSFTASDSSSMYNSGTMQPKSLQIMPCIRF